jgi:hypothetical protein
MSPIGTTRPFAALNNAAAFGSRADLPKVKLKPRSFRAHGAAGIDLAARAQVPPQEVPDGGVANAEVHHELVDAQGEPTSRATKQ